MIDRKIIEANVARCLAMEPEEVARSEQILRTKGRRAFTVWSFLPRETPEQRAILVAQNTDVLAAHLTRNYPTDAWAACLLIEACCVDVNAPNTGPQGVGLWLRPEGWNQGSALSSQLAQTALTEGVVELSSYQMETRVY